VLGVTCDGASNNRLFFKLHQQLGDDQDHKFINNFSPEKRYLSFFPDPPHLIKTVHNGWANSKRHLWVRIQ